MDSADSHDGVRLVQLADELRTKLPLESLQPDALVSDIGRPDEDGYALIRRLRGQEAERGGFFPAVALTGLCARETTARVLAAAHQYVFRSRSIRQN